MFRWKGVYVRKTVLVHFEFTIKSPLSDICSRFLDNFAEMGMTLPNIVSHIHWTLLEKEKEARNADVVDRSTGSSVLAILLAFLHACHTLRASRLLLVTKLFQILLILVYIWPGLGLLVGFLLSSTRSEFGHISYQGQPYPTWVQVRKSILHTHQEEIILNQISTLCYRVICLNPGDGISDHWLHSGGSAHFWSHRGDCKNQD